MRRRACSALTACALLAWGTLPLAAQEAPFRDALSHPAESPVPVVQGPAAEGPRLVDRIVAVVDEDPILASDLERVIRLGLAEMESGEGPLDFRRRVLRDLIDQRLRFHEVDRFGLIQVPVEEIEVRTEEIRSRFATEAEYQARLHELSMTEEDLRQLVARQLTILAFVDERLGARVFVGLEEIEEYYEKELKPVLEAEGQDVPALEDVREPIRTVLRERRMISEIERWTEELNRKATVTNYFDSEHSGLPPVVRTLYESAPDGKN